jgi:hypothetical protein
MAEKETHEGGVSEMARSRKMSVVLKDAVLGRPLQDRSLEPPVLGAIETCYLCHEHENGETVCHEIPCK